VKRCFICDAKTTFILLCSLYALTKNGCRLLWFCCYRERSVCIHCRTIQQYLYRREFCRTCLPAVLLTVLSESTLYERLISFRRTKTDLYVVHNYCSVRAFLEQRRNYGNTRTCVPVQCQSDPCQDLTKKNINCWWGPDGRGYPWMVQTLVFTEYWQCKILPHCSKDRGRKHHAFEDRLCLCMSPQNCANCIRHILS